MARLGTCTGQQGLHRHSRGSPGPGLGALRVDQDDGRVDVEADGQRLGAADGDVDDLRHDVDTWHVHTGVSRSWEGAYADDVGTRPAALLGCCGTGGTAA